MKFLSIVLGLAAVGYFSVAHADTKNDETYRKLESFSKVLSYIEDHYIEKVPADKLIEDALRGITANLDPHTTYLPPDIINK
jgi:carboxyl-terminal processing protease